MGLAAFVATVLHQQDLARLLDPVGMIAIVSGLSDTWTTHRGEHAPGRPAALAARQPPAVARRGRRGARVHLSALSPRRIRPNAVAARVAARHAPRCRTTRMRAALRASPDHAVRSVRRTPIRRRDAIAPAARGHGAIAAHAREGLDGVRAAGRGRLSRLRRGAGAHGLARRPVAAAHRTCADLPDGGARQSWQPRVDDHSAADHLLRRRAGVGRARRAHGRDQRRRAGAGLGVLRRQVPGAGGGAGRLDARAGHRRRNRPSRAGLFDTSRSACTPRCCSDCN